MKRNFFRWFVVSLFAVGIGAVAQAQPPDRLVVDVPYNFVVNGKLLPAGKYNVKRNNDNNLRILHISGVENHASAVTLSTNVNDAREFHPSLTLVRAGDQTVLTKIQTADHVFTIPVAGTSSQTSEASQEQYLTGTSEPKR